MTKRTVYCLLACLFSMQIHAQTADYFPTAQQWERRTPAALQLKEAGISKAIQLARAGESKNPRNMEINHYRTFGKEPFGEGIGPFAERGEPTGVSGAAIGVVACLSTRMIWRGLDC
ncbi:MAG: hypothetical protein J0H85_10250 [Sediminibacterium magnilacihabitans]|jgi:hypothetical protein|nr:hypothetical protein [Sediminibacterium magnilacihabitans]PQV60222.1 hypothetical protein CLV53_10927 [Sediminibacterium magnilacihabitans]